VSIHADLSQYSEPELQRWLHLRAIEWCAWPVFLSQPLLPALLVAFSPVPLLIAVVAAEFLWRFVRYSFVSPRLASAGATFFVTAKWPLAIGATICLVLQHRYSVAALAIVWPLVASLASVPATLIAALFGRHTLVGAVELELAKRIGYVTRDATL
jgi:hypothetical protein